MVISPRLDNNYLMQKKIRLVKAPPPPGSTEEKPDYPSHELPKVFNASPETLDIIQSEVNKFVDLKSLNPNGPYKNVTLTKYKQKDPVTKEKKVFPQVYNWSIVGRQTPNYFKGRTISGRIQFPDSYPKEPPTLFVNFLEEGRPLRMVNLYLDGTVCHHTVNEACYAYPKFNVAYIMKELENLFYEPNSNDPADMTLGDYYSEYPNEYWDYVREQAKLLPEVEDE